ncbi:MAG: cobalamin biosynthesis protein [Deltaproteobacteria bacterium]
MRLDVFPITERAHLLAQRLLNIFPDVVIHAPDDLKHGGLKAKVQAAFREREAVLFISACGIAVRSIAPFLRGKHLDPAVVVMDERARFSISLAGGHLGGANALAEQIARIYKAELVITTATDIAGLPCAEDVVKMSGLAVENVIGIKPVNSAILEGSRVFIIDEDVRRLGSARVAFSRKGRAVFRFSSRFPVVRKPTDAFIYITPFVIRKDIPADALERTLVLRPREFVVGIGCMRGVSAAEIERAFFSVLREARISPLAVRRAATIDLKSNEKGLLRFAKKAGIELDFYSKEVLSGIKTPTKPSPVVLKIAGPSGVCESAALKSSGEKKLWIKKTICGRVTIALARAVSTS